MTMIEWLEVEFRSAGYEQVFEECKLSLLLWAEEMEDGDIVIVMDVLMYLRRMNNDHFTFEQFQRVFNTSKYMASQFTTFKQFQRVFKASKHMANQVELSITHSNVRKEGE